MSICCFMEMKGNPNQEVLGNRKENLICSFKTFDWEDCSKWDSLGKTIDNRWIAKTESKVKATKEREYEDVIRCQLGFLVFDVYSLLYYSSFFLFYVVINCRQFIIAYTWLYFNYSVLR